MLLEVMRRWIPGFVKKKKLDELFRATALAFQTEPPVARGSFAQRLSKYALFTRDQAKRRQESGRSTEEVKSRLYENSHVMGHQLRKSLHITTWEKSIAAMEVIYKLIGIDFQYGARGEITISKCFFSEYYSPEVCRLISSMDEGLAAGLSGGGRLCFKQRITEGNSCCKGYFLRGPSN